MPAFKDLVSNPLEGQPADQIFGELSKTLYFFINLTYILLYGALVIMVVYNFFKLGQKLFFADYEEAYEKFQAGILNILFILIGIVCLYGIRDILAIFLSTIGVVDGINVFKILPF
jgi:hypothetical protein